jgi:hypothetical protein
MDEARLKVYFEEMIDSVGAEFNHLFLPCPGVDIPPHMWTDDQSRAFQLHYPKL